MLKNQDLSKISKMANKECYCGSGKKYKKCCLELDNLESNGTRN